jgi:hypothetical protein
MCVAIDVPANAFLDSSGGRWQCERGFERVGDSCKKVDVPANAHLEYLGHGWDCNRGYERQEDECLAREVLAGDAIGDTR